MFAGLRAIATALAMVSVSFAAVVRSSAHASARERHSRERCRLSPVQPCFPERVYRR